MTDEHERRVDRRKPTFPRTPMGIATIAVPLSALFGALSWIVEKIVSIDETIIRLNAETISQESRIQDVSRNLDAARIRQERLVTLVDDLIKEQARLRELSDKLLKNPYIKDEPAKPE